MKYLFGLFLSVFLMTVAVTAQQPAASTAAADDEDWECGLTSPELVTLNVVVRSDKKGYLKNLTYKDFELYDEKTSQLIEFFTFDEQTNQYTIGFTPYVSSTPDGKWHKVKIKVKLPAEKKKGLGKIFVQGQDGYYSKQN